MNFIIILVSLLVSAIAAVFTLKRNNKRWIALLVALGVNTFILIGATWILYMINDEARVFGIGQTNLYELIFSIPIITWINLLIIEFMRTKMIRAKN